MIWANGLTSLGFNIFICKTDFSLTIPISHNMFHRGHRTLFLRHSHTNRLEDLQPLWQPSMRWDSVCYTILTLMVALEAFEPNYLYKHIGQL